MPVNKPINHSPIRKRRRELKLTQQALADILAGLGVVITRQQIGHYETGRSKVPVENLHALDRALDLMDGTLYYELNLKRHGGDE